jgi:hypothetical protein
MSKEIENDDKELELTAEEIVLDDDGEEVKVEIVDEDPVVELDDGPSVAQGIEELKAQLEEERQARLKAEKKFKTAKEKADRAQVEINKARDEVHDTNLQLLNGAISDIKREQGSYKAAIRDAMERGDFDKAAEYQEAMAVNVAKLMKIEEGKIAYENQAKSQPSSSDVVDNFASKLSPRSAEWVRKNPQYVTDPRLNRKMVAAHEMAIADGMMADTDDYFEYVEEMLNMNKRKDRPDPALNREDAVSEAAAPVQRRQAPPAAPVSRQAPSTTTTRPNVVRLNSAEREMAQMMGMTEQEYAKNKLVLIKEGKLPN